MLKFIKRCGVDYEDIRKQYLPKDLIRFVFDPVRKRMATVVELPKDEASTAEFGYSKRVHVKGASEIVLESCSMYLDEDGNK
jgi:Ca2+-transporting ATPase